MNTFSKWAVILSLSAANAFAADTAPLILDAPEPWVWVTDERIGTIRRHGDRIYLGGAFKALGPNTGNFSVRSSDGSPGPVEWPPIDGTVTAIVSDEAGGWFVGGQFDRVGADARDGLAHLRADATLDPWSPTFDGNVASLLLTSGTLYVAGNFSKANAANRGGIAAFNAATLSLLAWNPGSGATFSSQQSILSLVADAAGIYAGGTFDTAFKSNPRKGLVAFHPTLSQVLPLNPQPTGAIFSLDLDGDTLFVGGSFDAIAGVVRHNVAALSLTTGAALPLATVADQEVHSVDFENGWLYVGGPFKHLDGLPRTSAGAIDVSTATVTAFDPACFGSEASKVAIESIHSDGSVVYLGGDFTHAGSAERVGIAGVDATTGAALSFKADVAGQGATKALVIVDHAGQIAVGGKFQIVGAVQRTGIAALDADTLQLLDWNVALGTQLDPTKGGSAGDFAFKDGVLYLSGSFKTVNGVQRDRIAALDEATGAVIGSFDATTFPPPLSYGHLHLNSWALISQLENALDPVSGQPNPAWPASVNNTLTGTALAGDQHTLYAGGWFDEVGQPGGQSVSREHVAALDLETGILTSFNPGTDNFVESLVLEGSGLLIGGEFTKVAGLTRENLAEIDVVTGLPTPLSVDLSLNQGVFGVAATAGIVFFGGHFMLVNNEYHLNLAALDRASSKVLAWAPIADHDVTAAFVHRDLLLVSGDFRGFASGAHPNFAAFRVLTLTADKHAISVSAGGRQTLSLRCGKSLGGQSYWMLGSASGTRPGLEVFGVHLPLNFDSYLITSVFDPASLPMVNGIGTLDSNGFATARVELAPHSDPALVGVTLNHAGVVYDAATGTIRDVTNAVPLFLDH